MPFGGLLSAGISAGGSLLGDLFGSADRDKAAADRAAALQQWMDINIPSVEEQKVYLSKLKSAGELTPEMEAIVTAGPSAMEGISVDPRMKDHQLKSLETLGGLGNSGLSAQDRASLGEIRRNTARETTARDESILQDMARRGAGGSGAELAARMMSSQAANEDASVQGDRIAAMAQKNKLDAIAAAGQLGGQMRSQEFGEQSDILKSKDIANRFDAANRQSVYSRNTNANNNAAAANLANDQRIMDGNTNLDNQQEVNNKGLVQTRFDNQTKKATGTSAALNKDADAHTANANRTAGQVSGAAASVGDAITGVYANKAAPKEEEDTSKDPYGYSKMKGSR